MFLVFISGWLTAVERGFFNLWHADNIKQNGLIPPVVIKDRVLIDGRNRREAFTWSNRKLICLNISQASAIYNKRQQKHYTVIYCE